MTSMNIDKPTKKEQLGSKVNNLKIFLVGYVSTILEKIFGMK